MTCWQDAIPEVASLPANVTLTGALYQPFAFGCRSTLAPVTVGLSLSILNWRCRLAPTGEPSVAVQSSVSELAWNVFTAGQLVSVAPATPICPVTSLTYQPLSPVVPEVTVGVIVGAATAWPARASAAIATARGASFFIDLRIQSAACRTRRGAEQASARRDERQERERGRDEVPRRRGHRGQHVGPAGRQREAAAHAARHPDHRDAPADRPGQPQANDRAPLRRGSNVSDRARLGRSRRRGRRHVNRRGGR